MASVRLVRGRWLISYRGARGRRVTHVSSAKTKVEALWLAEEMERRSAELVRGHVSDEVTRRHYEGAADYHRARALAKQMKADALGPDERDEQLGALGWLMVLCHEQCAERCKVQDGAWRHTERCHHIQVSLRSALRAAGVVR